VVIRGILWIKFVQSENNYNVNLQRLHANLLLAIESYPTILINGVTVQYCNYVVEFADFLALQGESVREIAGNIIVTKNNSVNVK
jgi:hypothetical protein